MRAGFDFLSPAGPGTTGSRTPAAPRWSLDSVYQSFDSEAYIQEKVKLKIQIDEFLTLLNSAANLVNIEDGVLALIEAYNGIYALSANLEAYCEAVYTTDTRDSRALGEINAIEGLLLPFKKGTVLFRGLLYRQREGIEKLLTGESKLSPYRFFLREAIAKAAYQMSPELEDLANDLSRSGGGAFSRLQEAVSSNLRGLLDGEPKTVNELRALAMHPDRAMREKAYRAELAAWASVEIPLAAALNGVKGHAISVDTRRGWKGPLEKTWFQARLGEKSFTALIAALEGALPAYRRYLAAKARALGLEKCAFFDLFASVGGGGRAWTWEEAAAFIVERYSAFDPAMGRFARKAFDSRWIDGEIREGKVGGAYCTAFPLPLEPRVLCNFDGTFDSVITLAHELGHAWHCEVIKDLPFINCIYPMTLAETASIFGETIVFEASLAAASEKEKIGLIESNLKDSCQVIVDILSRFYFERELFERRAKGEVSPAELCAMMLDAQKKTYGEGLDAALLHPYMWAVKSHYYSPELAFYNYPYAFGQLFALGLYSRAAAEGPAFAAKYRELLRLTGSASAEDTARAAGFDIEDPAFWAQGIAVIEKRVREFEALTG